MKIFLDGEIYSSAPSGGIYKYFNEIIPRLASYPETELVLLTPKGSAPTPKAPGVTQETSNLGLGRWVPFPAVRRALSPFKKTLEGIWLKARVPAPTGQAVYHSAYYNLGPYPKLPQVFTVYDAISELITDFPSPANEALSRRKSLSLPKADRLLAISATTKRDISHFYGIPESKIDVVPLGVDASFYQAPWSTEAKTQFRTTLALPARYLLYVGGRLGHKNFSRALEAFAQSQAVKEVPLVVAGHSWTEDEQKQIKALGLGTKLHLVPSPSDETLRGLYREAIGFVYPSLYEGFGIPLLEAFACSTPVATSLAGSMPEIAGNAAIYFNPQDPSSIAEGIDQLLDPSVTPDLIKKGLARVAEYTWENTARLTRESYLKALS